MLHLPMSIVSDKLIGNLTYLKGYGIISSLEVFMATGKVHDEHIANILGKEFSLKRPEELRLIQDAVYVLMDATVKDKNGRRLNEALHIRLY